MRSHRGPENLTPHAPPRPTWYTLHETTVRIRDDQHEWLKERDGINLSGLLRDAIDDRMEARDD